MKLTIEEINAIADILGEKIGDNFNDACWNIISERTENYDFEVSDSDVREIKVELAKMLTYE